MRVGKRSRLQGCRLPSYTCCGSGGMELAGWGFWRDRSFGRLADPRDISAMADYVIGPPRLSSKRVLIKMWLYVLVPESCILLFPCP